MPEAEPNATPEKELLPGDIPRTEADIAAAHVACAPIFIGLSVLLYVIALFQKVFQYGSHVVPSNQYFDPHLPMYGFTIVLFGWLKLLFFLFCILQFGPGAPLQLLGAMGWLANPLVFLSLVLFKINRNWSAYLSYGALVLATVSLMIIGQHDPFCVIKGAEQDATEPFILQVEGALTWWLSICCLTIANVLAGPEDSRKGNSCIGTEAGVSDGSHPSA